MSGTKRTLGWCFVGSAGIYGALLWLGPRYALEVPVADRPILLVLALYAVAFVMYFTALRAAVRSPSTSRLVGWIVGTSIVLRALLLPTPPFQEIDIYRYLWDGAAVAAGIDPYATPPQAVVDKLAGSLEDAPSLVQLTHIVEEQPALGEILRAIHYSELPSPYPPVSQVVFAAAAATTLDSCPAFARLVRLKGWLTCFDIATLLVVVALLRRLQMPLGWAIAYGWCPLVLKEVAGSGHLDAIATFFATAAVALGVFAVTSRGGQRTALAASMLLGLGVGAKLYPIVLAPWLAAGLLARCGWRVTAAGAAVFLLTCGTTLWPMLGPAGRTTSTPSEAPAKAIIARTNSDAESLPTPPSTIAADEPASKTDGISAFLTEWEMNDLVFMVVYENLRWRGETPAELTPWFDITPKEWSMPFRNRDARAFLLTRGLTGALFGVVAVGLAWQSTRRMDGTCKAANAWVRAAFLTLAWFWLLAPTQNPWYWCWALPLLPWAGSRAWFVMSAMVMAYYLRFWLETAYPAPGVAGTPYTGEYFFYFVVPWIEFGPVLAWLAIEAVIVRRRKRLELLDHQPNGDVASAII